MCEIIVTNLGLHLPHIPLPLLDNLPVGNHFLEDGAALPGVDVQQPGNVLLPGDLGVVDGGTTVSFK